jgi:hypothetical protein
VSFVHYLWIFGIIDIEWLCHDFPSRASVLRRHGPEAGGGAVDQHVVGEVAGDEDGAAAGRPPRRSRSESRRPGLHQQEDRLGDGRPKTVSRAWSTAASSEGAVALSGDPGSSGQGKRWGPAGRGQIAGMSSLNATATRSKALASVASS